MESNIIYIPTPVSEKPEKEGEYIVDNGKETYRANWSDQHGFYYNSFDNEVWRCEDVTYYLRPIPITEHPEYKRVVGLLENRVKNDVVQTGLIAVNIRDEAEKHWQDFKQQNNIPCTH